MQTELLRPVAAGVTEEDKSTTDGCDPRLKKEGLASEGQVPRYCAGNHLRALWISRSFFLHPSSTSPLLLLYMSRQDCQRHMRTFSDRNHNMLCRSMIGHRKIRRYASLILFCLGEQFLHNISHVNLGLSAGFRSLCASDVA